MRCSDLLLLLLGAALSLLMVQARSIKDEELQHHALSDKENGTGDQVTSTGLNKDPKGPVKVTLKESKGWFDPDKKAIKRTKAKSGARPKAKANTRPKRSGQVREKGRPLGRTLGTEFDGVHMPPYAGVGDLSSQIRNIIAQYSARHAAEQEHSGLGVGDLSDVIAALSDSIRNSQQLVEDQVMELREDNSAQLAAVVAAVNQSADSIASLAETAEETHGFLQTVAESLASINSMLHQYLQGVPLIGTAIPLETTIPTTEPTVTQGCSGYFCVEQIPCTGDWEMVGSDCVYISSRSSELRSRLSWSDARAFCINQGRGANLLVPTDIYTLYNYLKENNLNNDYWLGGHDLTSETHWTWVTGHSIVSDAWSAQPRHDTFLNCLNFSTYELLPLSAGDCNDVAYYMCQKPTEMNMMQGTTPGFSFWCEESYFKLGSENFLVVHEKMSWHDARSYCKAEGYDLAQPENITMLSQYLYDNRCGDDFWLGATDAADEGEWIWLSGRPVREEWKYGGPKGPNCLLFTVSNNPSLSDFFCFDEQRFICEKPMDELIEGDSLSLETDRIVELLHGMMTHPELSLDQNKTQLSKNETETPDPTSQMNVLFQFLNLFKPAENTTETRGSTNVSTVINTQVAPESLLNLTTESPTWSFSMKWSTANATEKPSSQDLCEEPYLKVGSECFLVVDEQMSWHDARSYCQAEGYDLAQPENIDVLRQNLRDGFFNDDYWIGGTDAADEGKWLWLSGRPVREKWMEGQPSGEEEQDCLDFQPAMDPSVNDFFCTHEQRFICEKPMEQSTESGSLALEADSFMELLHGVITHPELSLVQNKTHLSKNETETPDSSSQVNALFQFLNLFKPAENTTETRGLTNVTTEIPTKVAPVECYSMDQVPCSEFPDGENFPHPTDCNKFLKCVRGRVVVKTCRRRKLYNHLTGWCERNMNIIDCMCPLTTIPEETSESTNEVNGTSQFLNLFRPAENTTETLGDAFSNNMNDLLQLFTQIFHGAITQAAGWCGPPLKLVGNECFFVSDVLVDGKNGADESEMTWRDAQEFCIEKGGDLAEPSDPEALREIMTDGVLYWVGSKYDESEHTWKWLSGKPATQGITRDLDVNPWFCSAMYDFSVADSVGFDAYDCNKTQRWICEKPNPSVASLNETAVAEEESCEDPYVMIGSQCFNIINHKQETWDDAREDCKNNGGDLAVPSDLKVLQSYFNENPNVEGDYWLGGSDIDEEGTWLWLSGEEITSGWNNGEPFTDDSENCLDFRPDEVMPLHDYYCSSMQKYICEKPIPSVASLNETAVAEDSCTLPYEKVGSQCLYVGENEATWQEAQERCQNMNGNLAEVTEEQNTVIAFLRSKAGPWSWAWIARTSVSNSNQWRTSQNLVRGRWVEIPTATYEGCLKLGVEYGGYKPYDCMAGGGHYICERKVSSFVGPIDEESEPSEPPYMLVGSELFLVRNEKLSWSRAKRACEHLAGYLAEPQNLTALRNYMIKNNHDDDYWIGGSDEDNEGSWIWKRSGNPINGEWMEDQPGGETKQNCLDFQPKKLPSLNDYSCDVTQNYICQKDYQRSDEMGGTAIPETDLGNYTRIGTELFMIVKQKMPWTDAREYCLQNGGDLAMPQNLELLKNYLEAEDEVHDYWLGGTDRPVEGTWTWLSGESIVDSWKDNQPSGGRTQNCLDFRSGHTPSLNDYECDEPQYFICQTDESFSVISRTPSTVKLEEESCEVPFVMVGSECFNIIQNRDETWQDAREDCKNNGGDLAVPSDVKLLQSYLKENDMIGDYWLGGSDFDEEGTWLWLSGEVITSGWDDGEPNNDYTENCLDFRTEAVMPLHHYYCTSMQKYICEKPLTSTPDRNKTENTHPHPPEIQKLSTTTNSIEVKLTPSVLNGATTPIHGYKITYMQTPTPSPDQIINYTRPREDSLWESIQVRASTEAYTLENLLCGTEYQIRAFAYNKNGNGENSELLIARTKGNEPEAPRAYRFVKASPTSFTLHLDTWRDGGCPINYFVVEYKLRHEVDWTMASPYLEPSGNYVIKQLTPDTRYSLRILAYSDAKPIVAEYETSTLTAKGDGSCEDPYVMIGSECFNIVGYKEETWHDAREDCKNNGSDLAVPSDVKALQSYLYENDMRGDYWLGGSDIDEEGTWLWLSGEEITTGWDDDEPHNDNTENCLDFRTNAVMPLHDYYCSSTQQYICEKQLTSTPEINGTETEHITHLRMETSQCTIQTYIGLTRHAVHVDTELTLSKEYGRTESVNITKEDSHTFHGVDPGIYNLCLHTRVASNPITQSNCSNFVVEAEVPGIPNNVQAIGFNNGSISITWDLPNKSSCPAEKYLVQLVQEYDVMYEFTTDLIIDFKDLVPGLTYNMTVSAVNAVGKGDSTEIISVTIPTESCEEPFFALGDICYQVVEGLYNRYQARQLCLEQDADLLQTHSHKFLHNYLRDHDYANRVFWMGASDEDEVAKLNEETKWNGIQPDLNPNRNCMQLRFNQTNDYYLDHADCYDIENVICEKPITRSNYKKLYTQIGSEYFLVVNEFVEWNRAQEICQSKGGELAQPKDLDLLLNWIYNNKSNNALRFWLGASDIEIEGNWLWLNGSNVEQGWMKNEPDNRDGDENCLLFMISYNPSLNDANCYKTQSFICELNDNEPKVEEDPFFTLGVEKFLVVEEWRTWEEARTSCRSFGGDLAEPEDLELLKSHLKKHDQIDSDYWIGGSDSGNEGSWKWVSGATLNMSLWIDGEPDGDEIENCLDFQPLETPPLNDYECEETQYYICEKPVWNRNVISDGGCNSPFVQLGSECLLIISNLSRSWQEARNYCQGNDADLAILNDINRLRKYLSRNDLEYDFWVGGSNLDSDGEWLWVNGDPFTEEWQDGEPDDGFESNCLDFQSQSRPYYNAFSCTGEQSFICEKPTIAGKSVYDNRAKHPNNDVSSNFEITDSLDYNMEETTEELETTVNPYEVTDYFV